jgi:hypothetical protein
MGASGASGAQPQKYRLTAVITHIVTFKFTDRSASHLAECKAKLDGLLAVVPSLRTMVAGINVVESTRAHDLGLIATFDDLAGLQAYQVHPAHEEVAAYLRSAAETIAAVDFES